MIEIVSVPYRSIKSFIDFPHQLYAGDPNYVPEIYLAQKELLNPDKNPFFKHSKAAYFLARKEGKIVGRIAAIRNNPYISFAGLQVGFFGLFDVIEDYEVARALLDQAVEWNRSENLEIVIGPTNLTTNDTMGVLVKGFERPPVFQMTYNKPYYDLFLKRYGFHKKMDVLAYWLTEDTINKKSLRLADMLEQRLLKKGIRFRHPDMKNFSTEAEKIRKVYMEAWDENWGFVPPNREEFEHLAEGLKMVIDKDFVLIAEHEGKVIGFALALPDLNQVLRRVKKGRLLPTGIFKLLWGKRNINVMRIILLGVTEPYRKMGIEAIFYARIISNGLKKKYVAAEASWILEDNEMMNRGMLNLNADPYKTYRLYEKALTPG